MDKLYVADVSVPTESFPTDYGDMFCFWLDGQIDGDDVTVFINCKAGNEEKTAGNLAKLVGRTFECVLQNKGTDKNDVPKFKLLDYPEKYQSECNYLDDGPTLPVATKSEVEGKGESPAAEPRRPEQSEAPPRESRKLPSASPPSGKDSEIRKAVAFKGLVEIAVASDDLHTADGRLEWVVGMMSVAEEALL